MPRLTRPTGRTAPPRVLGLLAALGLLGCFDDPKPRGAPPPGPGYGEGGAPNEDRMLSRDDCLELRDQQVTIAAKEATDDPLKQQKAADALRIERKDDLEKWVKWCTGRVVHVKALRCMKESITLSGFLACGASPDAGADAQPEPKPDAASG